MKPVNTSICDNMDMIREKFDLAGRTALVTGSARGIGRAIMLAFAECGAHVIVHGSRESAPLDEALALARKFDPKATKVVADLSDPQAVDALPITQSPNHPIAQSPNHPITHSPNHPLTQSPNRPIAQSNNSPPTSSSAMRPFRRRSPGRNSRSTRRGRRFR